MEGNQARKAPPPTVSKRATSVTPFVVMEVMRAAAEKEKIQRETGTNDCNRVLHLEVGQPATGAPKGAIQAAISAFQSGSPLGYTGALGDLDLRNALADHYMRLYAVRVNPAHIAITTGSSAAFTAIFAACFDIGDHVVVPVPGYPCYRHVLAALGVIAVPVRTHATDGYVLCVSAVEAAAMRLGVQLRGIVVASPANPTGAVLSASVLSELATYCDANGAWLISDEIYHGIGTEKPTCALSESSRVVVVNSFSKYFSMTGYRIGWTILPDHILRRAVERLLQNLNICAPAISQRAALGALSCTKELDVHVRRYGANVVLLMRKLPALGFRDLSGGAFYVYASCSDISSRAGLQDSTELCSRVLQDVAVALTPGVDFDPEMGHRYLRFSCSGSTQDIELACKRLESWVNHHCTADADVDRIEVV